jgi:hypothetical protein
MATVASAAYKMLQSGAAPCSSTVSSMRGCIAAARKYSRLCCLPLMVAFMSSAAVSTARMPPSAGPAADRAGLVSALLLDKA